MDKKAAHTGQQLTPHASVVFAVAPAYHPAILHSCSCQVISQHGNTCGAASIYDQYAPLSRGLNHLQGRVGRGVACNLMSVLEKREPPASAATPPVPLAQDPARPPARPSHLPHCDIRLKAADGECLATAARGAAIAPAVHK